MHKRYKHVLDVYSLALVRNAVDGTPVVEPGVDVSGVAEEQDRHGRGRVAPYKHRDEDGMTRS
jgi:hypothetical protein